MTKPIRSFKNDDERKAVIARRIKGNTKGLGYVSAVEAERRENAKKTKKTVIATQGVE